ncbi:hypothetical protein Gohar_024945, partial [Gossypium harknessii]|nr:hypothetical protein [Gossypium harknessii]
DTKFYGPRGSNSGELAQTVLPSISFVFVNSPPKQVVSLWRRSKLYGICFV